MDLPVAHLLSVLPREAHEGQVARLLWGAQMIKQELWTQLPVLEALVCLLTLQPCNS
jgi:hypothetical protein